MSHHEVRNEIMPCHLSSALFCATVWLLPAPPHTCIFFLYYSLTNRICLVRAEVVLSVSKGRSRRVHPQDPSSLAKGTEKITNETRLDLQPGQTELIHLNHQSVPCWSFQGGQMERRLHRKFSHLHFPPHFIICAGIVRHSRKGVQIADLLFNKFTF